MIMRDLTLIWLKGGVPLDTWRQGKEFFCMNAIKISPVVIKKYSKHGDISYVFEKVKPFLSAFYQSEPLDGVNYLSEILDQIAGYADLEHVH